MELNRTAIYSNLDQKIYIIIKLAIILIHKKYNYKSAIEININALLIITPKQYKILIQRD